jgi:hypothetical protein
LHGANQPKQKKRERESDFGMTIATGHEGIFIEETKPKKTFVGMFDDFIPRQYPIRDKNPQLLPFFAWNFGCFRGL